MFKLFYTLALHLYGLFALPGLLLRPKGRSLSSWFARSAPKPQSGPVIWIHAPSLGETRACIPLVKRLRGELPRATLLFSTVTATGQAEAHKHLPELDQLFYLPFDLPYIIRPFVKSLQPDLVILAETDLWYHFLDEAKLVGAQIYLINGKVSERSARRLSRCPWLAKRLYDCVDTFCVQDRGYRERFVALGVPKKKIHITGNLKYDAPPPDITNEQLQELRQRLRLDPADRIVVLGSTHDPEEQQLLEQLHQIFEEWRNCKVLVVPRHPGRFDAVAALLAKSGVLWGRYSESAQLTGQERCLLVDAMGILSHCYALAELAIVAGSFTAKVGGHNVMEPLWHGTPVLFGPHMHGQPHMAQLLLGAGAARQVTVEEVGAEVGRLLRDESRRLALATAGETALQQVKGALDRTWSTFPLRYITRPR